MSAITSGQPRIDLNADCGESMTSWSMPDGAEILEVVADSYVMYYSGYSASNRAQILRATSEDGLLWQKEDDPVISPGDRLDRAKSSEMCIYRLPSGQNYRIVYEACDGTAENERGVWRIAGATSQA